MKKSFLFMSALFTCILIGCNDDKDNEDYGPIPTDGTSLVSKVTIDYSQEEGWEEKQVIHFSYDKQNRIQNITALTEYYENGQLGGDGKFEFNVVYSSKNTIDVNIKLTGQEYDIDEDDEDTRSGRKNSILNRKKSLQEKLAPLTRLSMDHGDLVEIQATVNLNTDGYIISGKSKQTDVMEDDVNISYNEWTVEYDSLSYISKSSFISKSPNIQSNEEYVYNWNNSNLTQIDKKLQSHGNTYHSTNKINYNDLINSEKINLNLNALMVEEITSMVDELTIFNYMGLYGKQSYNLISKYDNYSFTYKKDSKERINKVSIYYKGDLEEEMTIEYKN